MAQEKKPSTAQPLLLSVADVAVQLGVCRQTVYSLIYRQGLPTLLVGNQRKIHPASLNDWMKNREHSIQ